MRKTRALGDVEVMDLLSLWKNIKLSNLYDHRDNKDVFGKL